MDTLQTTTPAVLHHLHLNSADPERLSRFYASLLDLKTSRAEDGTCVLTGGQRCLLVSRGPDGTPAFIAFAVQDVAALERLRGRLAATVGSLEAVRSPLFSEGSFAILDPQGRRLVFGVAPANGYLDPMPGRLQHVVFQTTAIDPLVEFYVNRVGFAVSDRVVNEDGSLAAFFLRSDHEHHSLAFFVGSKNELDHHAYETTCWNDIRDWADRFGKARIPMFWGPGRHGPGNNLFFMVKDADGNKLELSAELETFGPGDPPRVWPNTEYTLNYWGSAWMRS
ncbi:MAG TPA: VOC family protein [Burkholderiales bacterium]|jgi:catechol-2,3-dioxygenase